MKYLESYIEKTNKKTVFWIIPFEGTKFEDAIVKTYFQYVDRGKETDKIGYIDDALGLAQNAKAMFKKEAFILLSMEFEIDPFMSPRFKFWEFEDKDSLEKDGFIFVGYTNTDKEEVELKIQTKKYNL